MLISPPFCPLDPPQALSPPTTYTGKLTVKLIAAHHLAPVGRALESSVVVKVDSVVRGKTKKAAKSTTPMWNESLAFKLDKNSELEIEVYDGSDMRGLAFFRLEDCMQELTLTGQMTAWFNVEPSGLIQISLSFGTGLKRAQPIFIDILTLYLLFWQCAKSRPFDVCRRSVVAVPSASAMLPIRFTCSVGIASRTRGSSQSAPSAATLLFADTRAWVHVSFSGGCFAFFPYRL